MAVFWTDIPVSSTYTVEVTQKVTPYKERYIYTPLSRLPDKFYALKCLWHMKPTFTLLTVPYLKITAVVATVYAFI